MNEQIIEFILQGKSEEEKRAILYCVNEVYDGKVFAKYVNFKAGERFPETGCCDIQTVIEVQAGIDFVSTPCGDDDRQLRYLKDGMSVCIPKDSGYFLHFHKDVELFMMFDKHCLIDCESYNLNEKIGRHLNGTLGGSSILWALLSERIDRHLKGEQ